MSWFELFYDLVIVAAVAHGSHVLSGGQSVSLGAWLIGTFVVAFVLWFSTSIAVNIAPGEVPARKTLMFVQMIAMTIANLSISRTEGLSDTWGFAGVAVAFATVAMIYALMARTIPALRAAALVWASSMGATAVILGFGALLPSDGGSRPAAVFAVAMVVAIVPMAVTGIPRLVRGSHTASEHLAERLGQFVIIVLGESFLGLVIVLDGFDRIPGPVYFALSLLVAGALWAVYFTGIFPMGLPGSAGRLELWLAGFVVFLVGAAYSASLHAEFAAQDDSAVADAHPFAPLPAAYVLVGALVLCWVGGERRVRSFALIHAAALAALAVAWAGLLLVGQESGQALILLGSGTVIVDGLACLAMQGRSRNPTGD